MLQNTGVKRGFFEPIFKENGFDNNRLPLINLITEEPISDLMAIRYEYKAVKTALILAAGDGTRLRPLTDDKPKVMVKIWGIPILERLLYNLKQSGISKAIIIVGYKSEVIKGHFGAIWSGINIEYMDAENYDDGILTSAVLAKGVINERFLFLLGDTIFETGTIKRAMKMDGDLVVGVRNEHIDESVGAFVRDDNTISKIGMLKKMDSWNRVVTGMAVCEPEFLEAVSECVTKGDYDRPGAMQLMIEKGYSVKAFDMTNDYWWESDDHKDLKKCRDEIFENAWRSRFSTTDLNLFKRFLNLPVSLPLTKLLALTNIRPNHLTAISLLLSLIACGSFVFGYFIIGGAFSYACAMIDATDGKISRLKLCQSDMGSFFDSIVDRISELAIVAGLSFGIYLESGSLYPLLIGFFACIAWLGRFYLKELYINKAGLNSWKQIKTPWNDFTGHRDISFFLTMVCCIAGYPLIPLIWMAVSGNLLSSIKLYNFFKHFMALSLLKREN